MASNSASPPSRARSRFISKSKYLAGRQCAKLLWHHYNAKDLIPETGASLQAIFDQGHAVGELAKQIGTTQSNMSQHLDQLRNKRILVSRKEANRIYYRVRNAALLELIGSMRSVLCQANLDDVPSR